MKKHFLLLLLLTFLICTSVFFVGCDDTTDNTNENGGSTTQTPSGDNNRNDDSISFKTFSVNDDNTINVKLKNGTNKFSFDQEIIVSGKADYTISTILLGQEVVVAKTVSLVDGDNIFYIDVSANNSVTRYTINLRVRPIYTVTFNTLGGTFIDGQQIEEDGLATEPKIQPEKKGYTFSGWNFDFENTSITENTTITVNDWRANYYTISFDACGLIDNPKEIKVQYLTKFTNLPIPQSDDMDFIKWVDSNHQTITEDSILTTADNIELYAIWDCGVTYSSYSGDDFCTVTGIDSFRTTEVVILDRFMGKKITTIGNNAFKNSGLEKITLGRNITTIGNSAFLDCHFLKTVIIKSNIELIDDYAFYNCNYLTSIIIPKSVKRIGFCAFDKCYSLQIFAEINSQPSTWDTLWNYANRPVHWGYIPSKNN